MPNISQNYNAIYQNPQFGNYNVPSKGIEDIKKQENVAGKVADNLDPTSNPLTKVKNFFLSLLASTGIVRLTNWGLKPKDVTPEMTVMDTFTNSRMYKIGQKIDNFGPLKWITTQCGKVKTALSKIPLPKFIKDLGHQYKIGSVSTWDKQGMYTIGKQSEAVQEFLNFLSEAGDDALKTLRIPKNCLDVINKAKLGKMNHMDAFKQIEPHIKSLSAKALKDISPKVDNISKFLGATKDLNLSFAKTQALGQDITAGPVGKLFNKLSTLTGEASGGGVLGGKMALVMNAFGLITAFNAASEAEKGDKLKAFMEDYLAYTIGGYLMGMVVGKIFNHALGYAEFGMNIARAKGIGKILGMTGVKRVQNVVIEYNKEFERNAKLTKFLSKLNKGGVVTGDKTYGKIVDFLKANNIEYTGSDVSALKDVVSKNVHSAEYMIKLRNAIQKTMKSNITLKSLKGKKGKELLNGIGQWLVQKPLAAIARFLSFGKYTMHKQNGNFIGNFFRGFKRIGGGIGRMILVGMILVSPFHKIFAKISHSIFGKPKNSLIDKDKEKDNPPFGQNNGEISPVPNGQNGINPQGQDAPKVTNINGTPSVNLVDLYSQYMPKKQQPQAASAPLNPSEADSIDNATYVPNQMLTQESYVDPHITQDLLMRRDLAYKHADSAEKNAVELLRSL